MWKIFAWHSCDLLGSSWQKLVVVKTMFLKETHRECFHLFDFPSLSCSSQSVKVGGKNSLKFPKWIVSKSYNTNTLKRTIFILLFWEVFLLQPSSAPVLLGQAQKTRNEEEEQSISSTSFPLPTGLVRDHHSPIQPSSPAAQPSCTIVSVSVEAPAS